MTPEHYEQALETYYRSTRFPPDGSPPAINRRALAKIAAYKMPRYIRSNNVKWAIGRRQINRLTTILQTHLTP
jgi:hypothetical protein